MKKLFVVAIFTMLVSYAQAQNNDIPNGDFEEWTTTGIIIQTTTPNDWHPLGVNMGYLSYNLTPINKTTDSQHGSYAAYIESNPLDQTTASIMQTLLESVDTSGALSQFIDFNTTVFPGVMTQGEIDIMSSAATFFTLIANFSNYFNNSDSTFDPSDISNLLSIMNGIDITNFIKGGMALNGTPDKISGYYKYLPGVPDTTAFVSDNGAAFLMGTYFDAANKTRHIAGGGATIFTEQNAYTNFDVNYYQISDNAPDSMVIIFLSSLTNGASGSKLYTDNLSISYLECNEVENISINEWDIDSISAIINWTNDPDVLGWQIEYGPTDFTPGNGTIMNVTENSCTISNLEAETNYDVYVRAQCSLGLYGNWSEKVSFTTKPHGIGLAQVESSKLYFYPNPSKGTLSLNTPDDNSYNIDIYNISGQKVYSFKNCKQGFRFDIPTIGAYTVTISNEQSFSQSKIIIID